METGTRRHDVDWMRIAAFSLLILYHAGRAYFPDDPWHLSDPPGSWNLRIVMDELLARWRLPLLFFISGFGTWHLWRSRSVGGFAWDRVKRLFIPLCVGMALIIPPQVWIERAWTGQTELGLLAWWGSEGYAGGPYPEGNISWHHLWYIVYLFVISLFLVPFLGLLDRVARSDWMRRIVGGPRVFALVALPLIAQFSLGLIWPEKSNGLFGDWGWLSVCGAWVVLGYVVAAHYGTFAETARRAWPVALAAFVALLGVVFLRQGSDNFEVGGVTVWNALTVPIAWSAILVLVAGFSRFANCDSTLKRHLTEIIYPLYIVHQTIALSLVAVMLSFEIEPLAKFGLVAFGTAVASYLLVLALSAMPNFIRAGFGFGKR